MIDPRLQKPVNAKLVLILIIVFAAVIRLYGIEDKCFSMDEAFSFEVCHGLRYDDTTPDLFYDICSVFLSLPFSNEVNGRLLSVIAGVLTVFVIYYIVNSLFSKKTALMITVMCSINPILVQISQEMRAYGLIAFFLSVSILSILKLAGDRNDEQTGKWKTDYFWILLFIVSSTVGLYTHYIMIPFLVCLGAVLLYALLRGFLSKRKTIFAGAAFSIILLLFTPHLSILLQRMALHQVSRGHELIKLPSVKVLIKSFWNLNQGYIYNFSWLKKPADYFSNPLQLAMFIASSALIILFIIGFVMLIKKRSYYSLIPILFIISFAVYMVMEISSVKQIGPLIILHFIILGAGLEVLFGGKKYLAVFLMVMVSSISLLWYLSQPFQPFNSVDWRAAGEYLEKNVQPGEIVFAACSELPFMTINYYYDGEIIPVDEEVKLYHTSPEHLKRKGYLKTDLNRKSVEVLKKLLQSRETVYVILCDNTDRITPLATEESPLSVKNFGNWLTIKKLDGYQNSCKTTIIGSN